MADQKNILESIRDIIGGKGEDDDILELTQMVNPDGSVSEIAPKAKPADTPVKKEPELKIVEKPEPKAEVKPELKPEPKTAVKAEEPSDDILSEIDSILSDKSGDKDKKIELEFAPLTESFSITEEFEKSPEQIQAEKESEELALLSAAASGTEPPIMPREELNQKEETMPDSESTIISENSAAAAKASISELTAKLKTQGREANSVEPSAPFRSGATVEDLVVEMLKPMMKDWLDKNLPKLVNEIVQKEIQKLIPRD